MKKKIEILGMGCSKCKQLTANAEAAVKELSIEAEISKVTDIDKITGYGVMMTPALVIGGKVFSTGKLLSKDEIKKIILTGEKGEKNNSCDCGGCCGK
jgi:small redox-active disulfide protein 2